jgi:hypothetical protein
MSKAESAITSPVNKKLYKKESSHVKNVPKQVTFVLMSGSVTKFKLVGGKTNEGGFNIQEVKEKEQKAKERDIRMEYFVDCRDGANFDEGIKTPPKKKLLGSAEKPPIPGYQNRFALSSNNLKPTK